MKREPMKDWKTNTTCSDPILYKKLYMNEIWIENNKPSDKLEGVKHNKNKLPMSKIFKQFPRALQAVMLASCYGNHCYKDSDKDWMNFSRVKTGSEGYGDAAIRHILDKQIYGNEDVESGLPHIFHELWDKMAECEIWIKDNEIDIKEFAKEYLNSLSERNK